MAANALLNGSCCFAGATAGYLDLIWEKGDGFERRTFRDAATVDNSTLDMRTYGERTVSWR